MRTIGRRRLEDVTGRVATIAATISLTVSSQSYTAVLQVLKYWLVRNGDEPSGVVADDEPVAALRDLDRIDAIVREPRHQIADLRSATEFLRILGTFTGSVSATGVGASPSERDLK